MNLLINEPPLQVLPTLAAEIGLNNAIVLQQMHYWLRVSNNYRDGYKWVYRTMDEWLPEFPFWSKSTVERIIRDLEKSKILVSGNYNRLKMDRTKWYRIDYKLLEKQHDDANHQNEVMQTINMKESKHSNCSDGNNQNEVNEPVNMTVPITREYTENTTENTQKKNNSRKRVYDESSVHYQLAYKLYQKILIDDPNFKQPNMDTWADSIRLMIEQDDRTEEQIIYLIDWSQDNSFWKSNILSTKKLREKATTLIRQIKADSEKAKGAEAKIASKGNYRRREELVPDWFYKRKEGVTTQPTSITEPEGQVTDFEVERQKMLAKLENKP